MTHNIRDLLQRLDPAALGQVRQRLMQRIVYTGQGATQRVTYVRTGHLRRSWYAEVQSAGERGTIGTTVDYARFQKNDPLVEGMAASEDRIQQFVDQAVDELIKQVAG
jgi:hypothetical protein